MNNTEENDTILSGREIKLLNRKESNYPELCSLCLDFEFKIIELLVSSPDKKELWPKKYILRANTLGSKALTPRFNSLSELEHFCKINLVQLLSDYMNIEKSNESNGTNNQPQLKAI